MRMTGHEMRTPLVAVGGLLDLLAQKIPPDETGAVCLDLILRSKNRMEAMGDLVDDLLEYSRLQAVLPAAERSRFDLAGVVRTASEELEVLAASKEIAVTLQLDSCEFEGNREQMLSLVKNLLSNSLQYTPRSGKVEVRLHRENGRAILETQDSGIGISVEPLGRIFEEFFRASEARQLVPGGTGLGLALCKKIVENHGGSIEVQSKPDQGTLFRVTLPLPAA
jgi:signal transduction histidine kinase